MLATLLPLVGLARAQPAPTPELLAATVLLNVREQPSGLSRLRGRLAPGYAVVAVGRVEGPGCEEGWAVLAGDGYACSRWLVPTQDAPVPVPRLVPFDHPEPDEYAAYRETGTYDRAPVAEAEPLLPFIYAKRWRSWRGEVYASVEHYAHGDPPTDQLDRGSKHAFLAAVDTPRGQVLVQEDGTVVPADDVFLYPVDRFQGRDLVLDPVPMGTLPAWAVRYDGARVHTAPDSKALVGRVLPYHQPLVVEATPASEDGHWWRVPEGLGPGVDGYVDDRTDVRRWVPSPAPPGLSAEEVWLDVDKGQQVAGLRKGEALLYLTLVSTGTGGRYETPSGLYRLTDETAWGDMESLPGAEEEYSVERVPWVSHFWPRYALHGVFWHWGFGHRASHGCINLAPRDAAWLAARLGPVVPPGWHTVYASPANPGAVIRVRDGQGAVPDRR